LSQRTKTSLGVSPPSACPPRRRCGRSAAVGVGPRASPASRRARDGAASIGGSTTAAPTDTAQWLVERGITLFATDLIGMDDPHEWWWPTHEIWLKKGICMVQQLCNLDRLVDKEFLFVCLPLKMKGGTASPVRPVALVM
jgi:kynurenine formamidase